MTAIEKGPARLFLFSLLAWSLVGILHASSRYADVVRYNLPNPVTWLDFIYFILSYSIWSLLTVATVMLLAHFSARLRWWQWVAGAVFGLLVWLLVYFSYDFFVSVFTRDRPFSAYFDVLQSHSAAIIFFYTVLYFLNLVVCIAVHLMIKTLRIQRQNNLLVQQKAESEVTLSHQRIQLLQSQLSPHFLFNCLGAISGLARSERRDALITAVASVGSLLRFTISNARQSTILLVEELAFVDDYVALQRLRYPERFHFSQNLGNTDLRLTCPPFFIQPLIENVFTHAIEVSHASVDITLEVAQKQGRLTVSVTNSTPQQVTDANSCGVSLDNLRNRLSALYPDDFTFALTPDPIRFAAVINIPARQGVMDV